MVEKSIAIVAAALAVVIFCAVFAGCTGSPDAGGETAAPTPVQTSVVPVTTEESAYAVADATNNFAFSLYKTLNDENSVDTNLFYSPFSISSAFALVYEGAKGQTADEINSVFFFPESIETLRNGFMEINKGINAGDSEYNLSVANALWAEKTYPFLDSYINAANDYYSAKTVNLDFINSPEKSRFIINEWAEEKTGEKIANLIPEGMINPLTRLVITNAVYFKGEWVKQFDINETKEALFTTASGKSVKTELMQRTDKNAVFGYAETDSIQVLKMNYDSEGGKKLSMVVLLPKENSLSKADEYLTAEKFSSLVNSLESEQVEVFIPKFKLETEYLLSEILYKMGMPLAFSDNADLSGMDGTQNLFISDVVHKAYVDVNEQGTEAAAATAVLVQLKSMTKEPVAVFYADHPFIFVILDDETGNIIFMGRICNPE
ncbi:MAG: serpin family protein [Methanomicrobium sp.]|nr:serpin family protein [Methanomicrobium sp.]